MTTTTTATKDMWVANLVYPCRGDSNSIPVNEFFESVDEAAEMDRLSAISATKIEKGCQVILFSAAAVESR